jgi:hypothetical protein
MKVNLGRTSYHKNGRTSQKHGLFYYEQIGSQ